MRATVLPFNLLGSLVTIKPEHQFCFPTGRGHRDEQGTEIPMAAVEAVDTETPPHLIRRI